MVIRWFEILQYRKGEEALYYEVYIDSLFLLNFTMNLYLLMPVNKSLNRAATRRRLFAGAAMGGAGYCLMFLLPFGAVMKTVSAAVLVNCGMVFFVFRPCSVKAFFKTFETMLLYSFLMGGGFLLLLNHVKPFRKHMMSVTGILACGGLFMLVFSHLAEGRREKKKVSCKVVLSGKQGSRITIQAIVDTGNSLKEPISGKPVSVLEKAVFDSLFGEEGPQEGFRAIPYRSVGCERGIMKGFLLPEMTIEQDGIKKVCRNVYVGVSERAVSSAASYRMLLHPELLEK